MICCRVFLPTVRGEIPDVHHRMVAGLELPYREEVGVLEDQTLVFLATLEGPAQLVGDHLVIPGG